MSQKHPTPRRGLGRGLGSLIPTAPVEEPAYVGAHSAGNGSAEHGSAENGGTDTLVAQRAGGDVDHAAGTPGTEQPSGQAGDQPAEVAGAYFAELPLGAITPNRVQPRQVTTWTRATSAASSGRAGRTETSAVPVRRGNGASGFTPAA